MGLENVPRCQHIKVNGTRCGSPALRRRRRCYFHEQFRIDRAKSASDVFAQRRLQLPVLEDANAVQVALMKVIEMLGYGRMDHRTAGLLLYALQTASYNLRHTTFEAESVPEAAIDSSPNHTDVSRRNGRQWLMRDSADDLQPGVPAEHEPAETDGELAASSQQVESEPAPQEVAKVKRVNREQVRMQVEGLIRNWVMETVAEREGAHPG